MKQSGSQTMTVAEYKKQKPSKYRNVRVEISGIPYASKKEANRALELATLLRAGKISDVCRQYPFKLEVNGTLICRYFADFVYHENGKTIVEDVKGVRTPVYKLKKKLMKAIHGIEIQEV